jgi:hypothetical protein
MFAGAASTTEAAAQRKEHKYTEISRFQIFLPLAYEKICPIYRDG